MPRLTREQLPEESLYKMLDLSSPGVERLMIYLVEEHRQALSAHEEYFEELKMFRRAIKAKPATKVKTFPWPGASNFVASLIRIAGDAIKARIVNSLLGPKPFWLVSATSEGFVPFAKPWERFLEWAVASDLDLAQQVEMIVDQTVYLGKCPTKVCWIETVKPVKTYDRRTREIVTEVRTTRDQPIIIPILLENWLEPWGTEDSIEKPWNSHRVFLRAGDIKEAEKLGYLKNSQDIISSMLTRLPTNMQELTELHKLVWAETQVATLYETQVSFDINEDGFREDLVVLWHYDTGKPLSVKYNFFFHGNRPLHMFFYIRGSDDRSSGDGMCQLLYPIQDSLSTFINQRTDNITIANTRYWKGKKNSGLKKGEQVWPGRMFLLDDPTNDLIADKLGDVSPASFTHESILRDYGERLSGISDPQLGREFDNPRVAATTTLSILQEGNRRFDMVIKLMRGEFGKIGLRISQLYQQFQPRVRLEEILSPEDEVYVRQLLDMNPYDIEKNFVIQINTSTATSNKETQRQGLLALFNLITGFYSQVNSVGLQVIANPQVPEAVKNMIIEMATASHSILKEIVQSYDITDVDSVLVDVGEALKFVKAGGEPATIEQRMQAGLENFSAITGGGSVPGGSEGGGGQAIGAAAPGGQPEGEPLNPQLIAGQATS